jgi:plasmid stabilization system protein ParE
VELSVDWGTVITSVATLAPIATGTFLYLRQRDRLKLLRHVHDESGADAAARFALALDGKAHPALGPGEHEAGNGRVDERETPQVPRPRAPDRRPVERGGGHSGKGRHRRPDKPRAGEGVSLESTKPT